MKYLMLVCVDDANGKYTEGVEPDKAPDIEGWVDEMDGRGVRIVGERLREASDATTVRVRFGETLVVDGPYAETKEQIAGFDIIECADLDEAIEVARTHPMARAGRIELRPFADLDA
jgi:hypothetical protein